MAHVKYLSRNDVLYTAGDAICGLWKVVVGTVILTKYNADGKAQILDILGPGEFVDVQLSGRRQHEASAFTLTTLEHVDIADIDAETKEELFEQTLRRVTSLHDHALNLGRETAELRVSWLLRKLAAKATGAKDIGDSDQFEIPEEFLPSRQQIADFTGLTLETVSRILSKWKKQRRLEEVKGTRLLVRQFGREHRQRA